MKMLIGFILVVSASWAQASPLQTGANSSGEAFFRLTLKPSDTLAIAIKEAVIKSSEIKMVENPYVEKGTLFAGLGAELEIAKESISLLVRVTSKAPSTIVGDGDFASFADETGVAATLYKVLSTSSSPHVKRDGDRFRLFKNGSNFGDSWIECSPNFSDAKTITCSILLN